jgi:hypothetical protein
MPKFGLDLYCFLKRSILQVSAKWEMEARKLVDCQLSLFNGDLKSERRKQLPGCVFWNKLDGNEIIRRQSPL